MSENANIETTKEVFGPYEMSQACVELLMGEPFFAAISRRVDKSPNKNIPTAGVRVNKKSQNFELVYNPDFFLKLTKIQKQMVLKHEFYHLILEHVTSRKPVASDNLKDQVIHKLWNIATDLAINSYLPELPEFCLFPGKGEFKAFPPEMSAEWYFNKIMNDPQNQEMMKTLDEIQDMIGQHGEWNPGEGQSIDSEQEAANEMAKEKLKDILRKSVGECAQTSSWGTISESLKKDILERIASRLNWKHVLRYFIKTSQRANKSSSIRRINKRYPYIHSGTKINRTAKVAVCIDQSGSVSDELLVTFFSELEKLSKIAEFVVIPFDHEIAPAEKIYTWRKRQSHKVERVLTGGTSFDCFLPYVAERNFDGCIVMTDMCAEKPGPCKVQRLWITDTAHAENPYFTTNEMIIGIPEKDMRK